MPIELSRKFERGIQVRAESVDALRDRLARINAEWKSLSRQTTPTKVRRMEELRVRRQALTSAIIEAELALAAIDHRAVA